MATAKHNTLKSPGIADGRRLAARLLASMGRINTMEPTAGPGIMESRRLLLDALHAFGDLPAREQLRFVNTLNDWIGSAMSGSHLFEDIYLRKSAHQVEGHHARLDAIERKVSFTDQHQARPTIRA